MKLLTKEQQIQTQKENLEDKHTKDKKFCQDRGHFQYKGKQRGAVKSICNLRHIANKEIPIVLTIDLIMITILS